MGVLCLFFIFTFARFDKPIVEHDSWCIIVMRLAQSWDSAIDLGPVSIC
jgi:hypothetical protein